MSDLDKLITLKDSSSNSLDWSWRDSYCTYLTFPFFFFFSICRYLFFSTKIRKESSRCLQGTPRGLENAHCNALSSAHGPAQSWMREGSSRIGTSPTQPGRSLVIKLFLEHSSSPRLQRQYSWESLAIISGQPTKRGSSGGMLCLSVGAIWAERIGF